MNTEIDLTAYKQAYKKAKPWMFLFNPTLGAAYYAGQLLVDLLNAQGRITEDDAKNVAEIIKAGAESGVGEMTIKIPRENNIGINAKLGKIKAKRPFIFQVGMNGETEYEIRVKYK